MSRRLRVLQLGKYYPPHHGGMETHLQALCESLGDAVDLRVVVAADGMRTTRERVGQVDVTRLASLGTLASSPLCPGLLTEIRSERDDVVHLHVPNPAAMTAYVASGHRGRLVVTYHSDVVRQRLLGKLFAPLLQRVLARCSTIMVSSRGLVDNSDALRPHASRCRVVPFGIPLDWLRVPDPAVVARLRSEHGPRIVLAVGRLVPYKGFEYAVRAMEQVDGRLLIVGDGPLWGRLQALAAAPAVAGRVRLLGGVPDVVPYHHAADVFVLPSVAASETFGFVQLEAMACGKPVVNTSLPTGVPHVSLDGVTGLTVPPADVDALAAALRTLLEDEPLRERLGRAGRMRVDTEFDVRRMAEQTLAAYEACA